LKVELVYLYYQGRVGSKITFPEPALSLSSGLIGIGPDDRDGAGLNVGVQEFIESAGNAITV
jgi:hypothetical protein